MRKYNLILHNSFSKSFSSCITQLGIFNYTYAQKVYNNTFNSLNILRLFPNMFSYFSYPHCDKIYRRIIIDKTFLIIYFVETNNIHVLLFIDGRQYLNKENILL